jgi:hypothetical protein
MSPTMAGRTSLATGLTSANVLLGQQYELAPFDGTAEFGAVSTVNLVTVAIFSGSDILQQPGGSIAVNATESAPVYPDHFNWEDEIAEGDRLSMVFSNANAGTAVINWVVRLSPA